MLDAGPEDSRIGARPGKRQGRLVPHDAVVVIVSDFDGADADTCRAVGAMARHNDVVAMLIHDPLQSELPTAGRMIGSTNMSEQHDGTTFAGVRYEVAIHPLEPGSYAIADQKVALTYAAQPPATRQATLSLPRLSFAAIIPSAAQALDPFISATGIVLHQQIDPASGKLEVGDAVVRTVTVQADGIPAMC